MTAGVGEHPDRIVATAPDLPTFRRPRFAGLRIALNELLMMEGAAARLRWAVRNADEPQVCFGCDAPATVAKRDGYQGAFYGGPVFYSCDRHRAIPLDVPRYFNGYPFGRQMCSLGCGTRRDLDETGHVLGGGGPIAAEHCPHEWGPVIPY